MAASAHACVRVSPPRSDFLLQQPLSQRSSSSPSPSRLPLGSLSLQSPVQLRPSPLRTPRSRPGVCRGLFGLGLPELLVIGGVAVVLFGPKQLPEIGKSLGKTVKGFQEAAKEFSTELKQAAKGDEESAPASKGPGAETPNQTADSPAKGESK